MLPGRSLISIRGVLILNSHVRGAEQEEEQEEEQGEERKEDQGRSVLFSIGASMLAMIVIIIVACGRRGLGQRLWGR